MSDKKPLKLKYGEYYSLKITDSSKNIINNVEISSTIIDSKQALLSPESKRKEGNDNVVICNHLSANSESNIEELQKNMTDEQKKDDEFFSWIYLQFDKNLLTNGELLIKDATFYHEQEITKHEIKCELQIGIQFRLYNWLGKFKGFSPMVYYWTEEFTNPKIDKVSDDLLSVECRIELKNDKLNAFLRQNNNFMQYEVKNWRYKLTGGEVKMEKLKKEIATDYESQLLRGKHSYSYPDSTLLQNDATFNGKDLTEHIANHILKQYGEGRETFEMTWQGDPHYTIGDRIILEDKLGIEKKFMITGNEFILENSGKFYMRTEGISVIGIDI